MSWSTDLTDDVIDLESIEHKPKRRRFLFLLGAAFAIQLAAMVVIAWLALHVAEPDVWDPLGDYPVQQADDEVVISDERQSIVRTFGRKCADEEVPVVGSMSWQSLEPRGSTVVVIAPEAGGKSTRRQGCQDFDFANPVPAEVVRLTRVVGGGEMVWQINGLEVPTAVDGRQGVPRAWSTTPIVVRLAD